MNLRSWLGIGLILGVVSPCLGQKLANGDDFVPNKTPLATRLIGNVRLPRKVWVAVDNYRPFETKNLKERVIGSQLKFLQECYVIQSDQGQSVHSLFLGKSNPAGTHAEAAYGWIDKNLVIEGNTALRDLSTKVSVKAMIVNTPESVAAGKKLLALDQNVNTLVAALDRKEIPGAIITAFSGKGISFSDKKTLEVETEGENWVVVDPGYPPQFLKVEKGSDGYGVEDLFSRHSIFVQKGDFATDLNAGRIPLILLNKIRETGRLLTSRVKVTETGGSWRIEDPGYKPLRFEIRKVGAELVVADSLAQSGVYSAPDVSSTRRTTFQLFNHFFVYAKTPGYVLLGSLPNFYETPNSPSHFSRVIKGWIPTSRVALWSTREALEWDVLTRNKRTGNPGKVFGSGTDATDFEDKKKPEPKGRFVEGSASYSPYDPRFPVLQMDRKDLTPHLLTRNQMFRVGGMGGSNPIRKKFGEVEESLRKLELVFVIDDTKSMDPYLGAMADAVEKIANDVVMRALTRKDRSVDIAISWYSDRPSDTPVRPFPLKRIVSREISAEQSQAAIKQMVDKLRNKTTFSASGGEAEMVLAGLLAAESQANFSPAARKIIVLIGDAGDHLTEKIQDAKAKKSKLTEAGKDVAKALYRSDRTRVELYAIQVEKPRRIGDSRALEAVLFEEQMKFITDYLNEQSNGALLAGYYHASSTTELAKAIESKYQAIDKRTDEWSGKVARLRLGEWHTKIDEGLKDYLKRAGVDVDDLKNRVGGQIFQEGYVWQYARGTSGTKNPVPQVRPVYLMSETEIKEIQTMLTGIVGGGKVAPQIVNPGKLKSLVQDVIETLTGEANSNRSLSEVFLLKHGLEFHSPLLKKKPSEIQNVDFKELQELKHKQQRLADLLQNLQYGHDETVIENGKTRKRFVEVDWKWITVRDDGGKNQFVLQIPKGNEKRVVNQYFTLPGDPTWWYWVDLEKEIP